MKTQTVFKRHEVKYLITKSQYQELVEEIKNYTHGDEYGKSSIISLYFDTDNLEIIRNSIEKPIYKEKLRLRSYGVPQDNDRVFLELKNKYKGVVYKRRISMKAKDIEHLEKVLEKDNQIAREIQSFCQRYANLHPSMLLIYEREAYYDNYDVNLRITFDANIMYRNYDLDLRKGIYGKKLLDENTYLMEIKTGSSIPIWLVSILSQRKLYKTSFSKYGSAYKELIQMKEVS